MQALLPKNTYMIYGMAMQCCSSHFCFVITFQLQLPTNYPYSGSVLLCTLFQVNGQTVPHIML